MEEAALNERSGSALAMRSPINWAVLGLLIERTGYGYELFHRFERTYGDALQLSTPSQIYGALEALERKGLIERLPSERPNAEPERQPKPRYQATELGKSDYLDWLMAQVTQERQRSELFPLQVAALPPRDALVVIERYERHLLAERTSARPAMMLDGSSPLARELVEEARRSETGVALKWTAYARRKLEATVNADAQTPHR